MKGEGQTCGKFFFKFHIPDLLHFLQVNGQDYLVAMHTNAILQRRNPARAGILTIKEFIEQTDYGGSQRALPCFLKSCITPRTNQALLSLLILSFILSFSSI